MRVVRSRGPRLPMQTPLCCNQICEMTTQFILEKFSRFKNDIALIAKSIHSNKHPEVGFFFSVFLFSLPTHERKAAAFLYDAARATVITGSTASANNGRRSTEPVVVSKPSICRWLMLIKIMICDPLGD